MKKISTDFKYLIALWVILILAIIPTYAHHGHLILDCGREVYYPLQVLSGKILYKDLFVLYGPFSYMFNAFLYKLFGANLSVLYLSGCVCSFLIVSLTYLISKRFLSKFLSFAIGVFSITLGLFSLHLFNYIFPYSYSILYGTVAFLFSILFLLKYIDAPEKTADFYLTCFFAGLCFANKYEFLPYLAVVLYAMFKIKRLKFSEYYYSIFSLLAVPAFCFGVLFLQGLTVNDLILNAQNLLKMAQTQTFKYFYVSQGVYFNRMTILFLLFNFIKTVIPLAILLFGLKSKSRIVSSVLIPISIALIGFSISAVSFAFFPVLVLILIILNYRSLKSDHALMFLSLSALAVALKNFWGLPTFNYGLYFVSFILITVLALVCCRFKNLDNKALGIYVLLVALSLGIQNGSKLVLKKDFIKTQRGKIYVSDLLYSQSEQIVEYIQKNTKNDDEIVIFPEGLMINFLTERKSDDYYNSLIPIYVELFGDDKLIEHFKNTKPEYIIFNNWHTSDYGVNSICNDYAQKFCSFVASDYKQVKVIEGQFRYLIFKRK